jgi:uncharacterized protein YndB with AHSA1/START domain
MVTELSAARETAYEKQIEAAAAEVFWGLTAPQALRAWLCNTAHVTPGRGGRIYLAWNNGHHITGNVTEWRPGETVAYTWHGKGESEPSELRFTIQEEGEGRSTLTTSGTGGTQGPLDWQVALNDLAEFLVTGFDPRLARRPMFGLSGAEEMNSELARRHGTSIEEGLRLTGLVEGMGAQASGLQSGDILVSLGGKPVTSYASLGEAIQGYNAGDEVPAEFYRGDERHTVTVTLSRRQLPEIPATHNDLVTRLRELQDEVNTELDALLAEVSEEEANYRLAPDSWNAKQAVAHMIATEFDTQAWVASMEEGVDVENIYHSNTDIRLKGIIAAYPTLKELGEALKKAQQITLGMAEALPESIIKRKGEYNNLAGWWTDFVNHNREHFGEIRQLAEAARRR